MMTPLLTFLYLCLYDLNKAFDRQTGLLLFIRVSYNLQLRWPMPGSGCLYIATYLLELLLVTD